MSIFRGLIPWGGMERQSKESEYERPIKYFAWLWGLRVLVLLILIFIMPTLIGRMLPLFMLVALLSIMKWGKLQPDTFPRSGMTKIEWWSLLALSIALLCAAAADVCGWQVWPAPIVWGVDWQARRLTMSYHIRALLMTFHADRRTVSGSILWLRLFLVGVFSVALYKPGTLLDWVFRIESQASGLRNVQARPVAPSHTTPDGLVMRMPNEKVPAAPVVGGMDFDISEEEVTL